MLDTNSRKFVQPMISNSARFFIKYKISANQVTILALVIGIMPAICLYLNGAKEIAVFLLWCSGYLDALDGTIARLTNTSSAFGTIMDIVFDRVVEISLILILAFLNPELTYLFVILSCAIILSMTVFLTVAAASEKIGDKSFYYQPGLAERTEGFIMFSLMILFPKYIQATCIIFIVMIILTAIQRFIEAYHHFKN